MIFKILPVDLKQSAWAFLDIKINEKKSDFCYLINAFERHGFSVRISLWFRLIWRIFFFKILVDFSLFCWNLTGVQTLRKLLGRKKSDFSLVGLTFQQLQVRLQKILQELLCCCGWGSRSLFEKENGGAEFKDHPKICKAMRKKEKFIKSNPDIFLQKYISMSSVNTCLHEIIIKIYFWVVVKICNTLHKFVFKKSALKIFASNL